MWGGCHAQDPSQSRRPTPFCSENRKCKVHPGFTVSEPCQTISGGGGPGTPTHPRQGTDLRRPTRPGNQQTLKVSVRDKPAEPATSGVD